MPNWFSWSHPWLDLINTSFFYSFSHKYICIFKINKNKMKVCKNLHCFCWIVYNNPTQNHSEHWNQHWCCDLKFLLTLLLSKNLVHSICWIIIFFSIQMFRFLMFEHTFKCVQKIIVSNINNWKRGKSLLNGWTHERCCNEWLANNNCLKKIVFPSVFILKIDYNDTHW